MSTYALELQQLLTTGGVRASEITRVFTNGVSCARHRWNFWTVCSTSISSSWSGVPISGPTEHSGLATRTLEQRLKPPSFYWPCVEVVG